MRCRQRILLTLTVVLAGLVGAGTGLVQTTAGLRALVRVTQAFVPELTVGEVAGTVFTPQLENVRFENAAVRLHVGQLQGRWTWQGLMHPTVRIPSFRLADAQVDLLGAGAETTASDSTVRLAVGVDLEQLQIVNLTVRQKAMTVHWDEIHSSVKASGRHIVLGKTLSRGMQVLPCAEERKQTAPQLSLQEQLQRLTATPLGQQIGAVALPVDVTVEQFEARDWRYGSQSALRADRLLVRADWQDSVMTIRELQLASPLGELQGTMRLSFKNNRAVSGRWHAQNAAGRGQPAQIDLTVSGTLAERLELSAALKGPAQAQVSAQVDMQQAGWPVQIDLTADAMTLSGKGRSAVAVQQTHFVLRGPLTDYRWRLDSALKVPAGQVLEVKAKGSGTAEYAAVTEAQMEHGGSQAQMTARADWTRPVRWKAQISAQSFDLKPFIPKLSAVISLHSQLQGQVDGSDWTARATDIAVTGQWGGKPLEFKADAQIGSTGEWRVGGLTAQLGSNRLQITGAGTRTTLQAQAQIQAPDLGAVWPGLAGNLQGAVRWQGPLDRPQIESDLQSTRLRYLEWSTKGVRLFARVDGLEQTHGEVRVQADRVRYGSVVLRQLQLTAQGSETSHRVGVKWLGRPVAMDWSMQGRMDRAKGTWQGQFTRALVNSQRGDWTMISYPKAQYAQGQFSLTGHCWRHEDSSVCLAPVLISQKQVQARVELMRLSSALLRPFLPAQTSVTGQLSATAALDWNRARGDAVPEVRLQGQADDVLFVKTSGQPDQPSARLELSSVKLQANFRQDRADLELLLTAPDQASVRSELQVLDPLGQRAITGRLEVRHLPLGTLTPFLQGTQFVQGRMQGDLTLSGAVRNPEVRGRMRLESVLFALDGMPFVMEPSELQVDFAGRRSQLTGSLHSSEGELKVRGEADWSDAGRWKARVQAQTQGFQIHVEPMVKARLQGDVTAQVDPQGLTLNGSLRVPWARLSVTQMDSSVVTASGDEVLLDANLEPISSPINAMKVGGDLRVHIGPDVSISAFGLDAGLLGDLQVRQSARGVGVIGSVRLQDGRFHAYGQDLTIEKGEMLFVGALNHPFVDMKAIRNPQATEDNVTVGVKVSGPAAEPEVEVFSEPSMAQQSALTYLLTGQGPDASSSEQSTLTSALVSLGVSQSGRLIGRIGQSFGIQDLGIDTEGVGQSSKVVVKGYVLPGLQVKYGMGLFDSLATLTLRYRVMPRLFVEAVSGVDQAVDILYRFDLN